MKRTDVVLINNFNNDFNHSRTYHRYMYKLNHHIKYTKQFGDGTTCWMITCCTVKPQTAVCKIIQRGDKRLAYNYYFLNCDQT